MTTNARELEKVKVEFTPDVDNFSCTNNENGKKCKSETHCCRFEWEPIIQFPDVEEIKKFYGYKIEDFCEPSMHCSTSDKSQEQLRTFNFELKKIDGRCIFLDKEDHCKIYEHRPFLCKRWPYKFNVENDGPNIIIRVTKVSPDPGRVCFGIGKGNSIREYMKKLAWEYYDKREYYDNRNSNP